MTPLQIIARELSNLSWADMRELGKDIFERLDGYLARNPDDDTETFLKETDVGDILSQWASAKKAEQQS